MINLLNLESKSATFSSNVKFYLRTLNNMHQLMSNRQIYKEMAKYYNQMTKVY